MPLRCCDESGGLSIVRLMDEDFRASTGLEDQSLCLCGPCADAYDARVGVCPGVWICSRIGPLTWGGVFVTFAFPPRTSPQPRSPIGLNSMPDCAPILGNLKRKCIIFFIHVCLELKFT